MVAAGLESLSGSPSGDEYVIGIDLGGTKLLAGLIDREGVVVERKVRATDTSSEEAVLAQIEIAVEELVNDAVVGIAREFRR